MKSCTLLNPRSQILPIPLCAILLAAPALAGNILLWTGAPLPSEDNVSDLPWVSGAEVPPEYIHEGTEDLGWLHGVAIIEHEGAFHTSWANSPSGENSSAERVRGKSLPVGQSNWLDQPVSTMADDPDGAENPDRRSHGAFWSVNGDLYAFPARWDEEGAGTHFPGLTFEAYKLNETTGGWESQGQAGNDSWTLDTPAQMANGNWIMGGVDANFRSAVLISDGDSPTQWTTVKPPRGGGNFSETTVIANGSEVLAIARNQNDNVAGVSISHDNGQTWSEFQATNFLMSDSKPAAGVLSTGQRYLISNQGPESDRDTLTIAVSRPGEKTFSKVWKIRDSASPDPDYPGDATKRSQWSYPYAHEHDGNLYVVYSATKEDAVLSVIPISDLTLDARAAGRRVAVDQFDYADGDLAGQPDEEDTAHGFTGAWSNPKTGGATGFVSTETAPLALPDGTDLPSSPRYVQHETGTGEAAWARRSLETASVDFGAEDTLFYVSAQISTAATGFSAWPWPGTTTSSMPPTDSMRTLRKTPPPNRRAAELAPTTARPGGRNSPSTAAKAAWGSVTASFIRIRASSGHSRVPFTTTSSERTPAPTFSTMPRASGC